jgi:hypothetical protein
MPHDDLDEDAPLPFVAVISEGGPYDDRAYEAGFQMGQLDIILGIPYVVYHTTVTYTTNVKQADLIAMHHGFKMEIESEEDEWTTLTFSVVCTCDETVT